MSLDAAASMELQARMAAFSEGFTDGALDWEPSEALTRLFDAEQLSQLQQLVVSDGAPNIVMHRLMEALSEAAATGAASVKGLALDSVEDLARAVEGALALPLSTAHTALLSMGMTEEQTRIAVAAAGLLGATAVVKAALSVVDRASSGVKAALSVVDRASSGVASAQDLPTTYDLDALHNFYSKRPILVARRFLEVSSTLSWFAIELLKDIAMGRWDENQPLRGQQLRELTSRNGPAFIKASVGQGASIRPDILPASWIKEMEKLQDRVEPFGAKEARATLEASLGRKLEDVFEDASVFAKPVAAASLGQVYKARLRATGDEVAVKVQRPEVLFTVTRDLYVMRIILNLLAKCGKIGPVRLGDTAKAFRSCIDSWAVRFMDELDYLTEAANADRFRLEMAKSEALGQAIIVPRVYHSMTTRYMLTTEWVTGEKLSKIDATKPEGRAMLAALQATLLNSYLTQLLESGFLHADPHPGNFLVTDAGKLVILDYGLMTELVILDYGLMTEFLVTADGNYVVLDYCLTTEVTEEQRYALVEYVIHLTSKDYDATLQDLITLQFIDARVGADPQKAALVVPLLAKKAALVVPLLAKDLTLQFIDPRVSADPQKAALVVPLLAKKAALVVPLLAKVMEQLSEGGGAKSITIEAVGEEVEELARNYPIGIPSYFGLIIRAFGSIEGLGLKLDPRYSIVQECFPYLARRLLTEDSPRMRKMLHSFLYGADGRTLQDSPRMRKMLHSFLYGADGRTLQVDQVRELIEGYMAFTALAAEASRGLAAHGLEPGAQGNKHMQGILAAAKGQASYDPLEDPVALDAIKLLFNKEGNYDLVVDELARMTDALGRELNLEAVRALRRLGRGALGPIPLPAFKSSALAPEGLNPLFLPVQGLKPLFLPVQLPYLMLDGVVGRVESALELDADDRQSLRALRRIIAILASAGRNLRALRRIIAILASAGRKQSSGGYHNPYAELPGEGAPSAMRSLSILSAFSGTSSISDADSDENLLSLEDVKPRAVSAAVLNSARRIAPVLPLITPGLSVVGEKFVRRLASSAPSGGQRTGKDGLGLDAIDAFASQGFKSAQQQGSGGAAPPDFSTAPPAAMQAPMQMQQQQQPMMMQAMPQGGMMGGMGGGMYATAMPMQMMPMGGMPFATSAGMMPMHAQQQQHPFSTAPSAAMMAGLTAGMGGMSLGAPSVNPFDQTAQMQQQQPQQQLPQAAYGMYQQPAGMRDPFSTAPPPAPAGSAPGAPSGAWDPFSTSAAGAAMANRAAPQQAQQQPAGAPAGQWDPFSGAPTAGAPAQQQAAEGAAAGGAGAGGGAAGWGDLTDADIWGDQKGEAKPAGAKSPASDDEPHTPSAHAGAAPPPGSSTYAASPPPGSVAKAALRAEWSDDDDGGAGSISSGRSPRAQEDSDYQLALKLQQEEEARARGEAPESASPPRTESKGSDKPDGECLARISKRTLLVWKNTYFIFELPDLLLLYRSRDDRLYNPRGLMIKKRIEIKHNHTLTPLKRKFYKDYGYLWHFTLEEQLDYGPSIVAKFGFQDKRPLEDLGNRIAEAIRDKRRVRARLNQYTTQYATPQYGQQRPAQRTNSPPPSSIYNAPPSTRGGGGGGGSYEGNYESRAAYNSYDQGGSSRGTGDGGDKYSRWGTIGP
ncbi:hypothetical protein JKP88DRAFT_351553 [Tribonema minus]|uniref:Protein kinase domain-containing protein n=1 Tax=Tribonema minus TaxID=303371 RepID=A0A836C852_9STRA|nr:hypothetical protein JKP88DRAFT_351553 [Tribonema minus]